MGSLTQTTTRWSLNKYLKKSKLGFQLVLVLLLCTQKVSGKIIKTLPINKLDTMTFENSQLFVGSQNRLLKLDENLAILENIETGPTEEGEDVDTKVIVTHKQSNRLITCSTYACHFRNLSDITSGSTKLSTADSKIDIPKNDPQFTIIAFIGPGPLGKDEVPVTTEDMLYVATTYHTKIDGDPYEVSTHTLNDLYIASEEGTFMNYAYGKDGIEELITQYITGFSVGGFSYFIANQPHITDLTSETTRAIIIQICQKDRKYVSYVEMPLVCQDSSDKVYENATSGIVTKPGEDLANTLGISTEEDVVIVSFKQGDTDPKNSAICIYTIKDIRAKFTENIKECYNGIGFTGEQFVGGGVRCKKYDNVEVNSDFCGSSIVGNDNRLLSGKKALTSTAKFTIDNTIITGMTIDIPWSMAVLFLATDNGHIKKVVLSQSGWENVSQFSDEIVEDGEPLKKDLFFSTDRKHLYTMTGNTLYKIAIDSCNESTECDECRIRPDPYCGWCSLEKSCTRRTECSYPEMNNRWQTRKSWNCVKISNVIPNSAPKKRQTMVEVKIQALPQTSSDTDYSCQFNEIKMKATRAQDSLVCQTPEYENLPDIKYPENDSTNVTLHIHSEETETNFLTTGFTFYDCTLHLTCTSCTQSAWGCTWCVHDNKCVDSDNATDDVCETPVDNVKPLKDSANCPRLNSNKIGQVLLPVNVRKEIGLHGSNFPEPLSDQDNYECLVYIKGNEPARVPATRINETYVVCNDDTYDYNENKEEIIVPFKLIWNNGYVIDNSSHVEVVVYKCSIKGPDCSVCVSLVESEKSKKYECAYCGGSCLYKHACIQEITNRCPLPSLDSVYPLSSPIDGGTRVTVDGKNLGTNSQQVETAVRLAGFECVSIAEEYEVSKRIVCRTKKVTSVKKGKVEVTIASSTVPYPEEFSYTDPKISDIVPKQGPQSGGTSLTILGTDLDTGNDITVYIGNEICSVERAAIESTRLVCKTPSLEEGEKPVRITFDEASRSANSTFEYFADPTISKIFPDRVYANGGRTITVEGTNFLNIQKPQIFLYNEEKETEKSDCTVKTKTVIHCPSPSFKKNLKARVKRAVDTYEIGFIMDDVVAVQNISNFPEAFTEMKVFPDPVYNSFVDGIKDYKGDELVLEGKDLNLACSANEVVVQIGAERCEKISLSDTKLVCTPPKEQPRSLVSDKFPQVSVKVGASLNFTLGMLEYVSGNKLPPAVIVGISVAGGILIFVIIIILILHQRRKTQAERQYKKMQIQLDTLESNVRNECRQAFAELQTEVTDLTSDISVAGIPFWDYKNYTFKVLFPRYTDHAVLHPSLDPRYNGTTRFKGGTQEQGLQQFNQLLNSKQFLVIFIRTMEAQTNFYIKDKAIMASLLMIVLQDKLEYATDILKALLNELVDKSVTKRNPKLMLRRTESVVEKFLSNWLSICMYGYLKRHAGKSVFMLFKAIKQQTEKGPIDAIGSDARYSLSEDRLLREKIEPKTLSINLIVDHERDAVTCKVLDCDTITQAKEKALDAVYMNTPNSRRPSVYDIDLEWRSGRSGHLPLQDEDVTTTTTGGWKKINTLAHYHVPDGATMALVHRKKSKDELVRQVHGMIEITGSDSLSAITPIMTIEEGTKVWHLVKQDDYENRSRAQKVISEIFLTRLLSTKGTVQKFIDDMFSNILRADNTLPVAVKYLFDFLEKAARRHNIVDPEVVHTWKSNSLPLRFWVNIIKNPDFVFDVHKSNTVDSCLSVIAQTFMDSCSTSDHKLGKDSPSNKLLFAKDIPKYKKWVEKYYKDIHDMPPVSDQDMYEAMMALSNKNPVDFNVTSALKDLYKYAIQYKYELVEALDEDPSAKRLHLAQKFEQVSAIIEGTPLY